MHPGGEAKGIDGAVVEPDVDRRARMVAEVVAQERRPRRQLQPAQPELAFCLLGQVGLDVTSDLGVPVRKAA